MTTTAYYGVEHIVEGSGQQAVPVSTGFDTFDAALAGRYSASVASGNITLTSAQFKNRFFEFTGTTPDTTRVVNVPAVSRLFVVYNNTVGGFSFTVKTTAGTGEVINYGARVILECDGTNVYAVGTVAGMATDVETAQDAIGAMIDSTLEYVDATPLLRRAALTGNVTAAAGSNVTTIAAGVVTEAMQVLADNTTQDVSTTQHGYVPKAPNDATRFLDGTGAFDTVKDSDLSTSDITTNNLTTSKHGFAPKAPNDATQFLDGTGAFSVPTTGQGKHSLWIPAGGMFPSATTGALAETIEMGTNKNTHRVLAFADGATKLYAEFDIAFPKKWNEGTITFQVFWTLNTTSTNSVVWGLQGVAISENDSLDAAYGTAQEVTDTGLGTSVYKCHVASESPAVTITGTPAESDLINFRLYRDPANGSDTLAATAYLLGIKLWYTTNANTDL